MKKTILTIGSIAMAATPVVTVISCGSSHKDGWQGDTYKFTTVSSNHYKFGSEIKYGAKLLKESIIDYIKHQYGENANLSASHWVGDREVDSFKSGTYTYELDVDVNGTVTKKLFDFVVESHDDKTKPVINVNAAHISEFEKVNDFEFSLKEHIKWNDKTPVANIIEKLKTIYTFSDNETSAENLNIVATWENNVNYSSSRVGTYTLVISVKDEANNMSKAKVNVTVDAPDATVAPRPTLHNELFASDYAGMTPTEAFGIINVQDPTGAATISALGAPDKMLQYITDHYINVRKYEVSKDVEKIDDSTFRITMDKPILESEFLKFIKIIESDPSSADRLITFSDADGKTADDAIQVSGSWGTQGAPSWDSAGKFAYSMIASDSDGNQYPVTVELIMPTTSPAKWVDKVFESISEKFANNPSANAIQVNVPEANVMGDFFFKYQGGKWVSSLVNTVITGWEMFKVNFTTATDAELQDAIKNHSEKGEWNDGKDWIHAHYSASISEWKPILLKAISKLFTAGMTKLQNSNIRLLKVDMALWGSENNYKNFTDFVAKYEGQAHVVTEIYKSSY